MAQPTETKMVNPAKLKSLVDQHAAGPSAAQLGMPQAPAPASDDGDMDEDDEEPEAKDPATRGQELITSWGEFGEALQDAASDLHDQATDVGPELLLKDVPPDAIKDVGKSVDRMPDDISMGLAKYVSKLPPEDVTALATALCSAVGADADLGLMNAYLTQAAKYAGAEIEVDDDFNEPEEDEDDDSEDAPPDDAADPGDSGPPPPPPAV